MSNQNHTAEPWEAITPCPGECCWHLQQVDNDNPMDLISNPEMSRADARRIVACVNACVGIPTDILEFNNTEGQTLDKYIRGVQLQRDELLSALTKVRDRFFPANQPEQDRDLMWGVVNAPISKAEAA